MPDDLLLINRQAEVPDLLTHAFREADRLWLDDEALDQSFEDYLIPALCAALGVGKPEQQVRESDLGTVIAGAHAGCDWANHLARGRFDQRHEYRKRGEEYVEAADRIERAIGEENHEDHRDHTQADL